MVLNPTDFLGGIKVYVSDFLDTPVLGNARPHHKRRINKKWRKKYGMKVVGYKEGKTFQFGDTIHCGRIAYEKLKREIPTVDR